MNLTTGEVFVVAAWAIMIVVWWARALRAARKETKHGETQV